MVSGGRVGGRLDPQLKAFIDRVVVPGLVECLLREMEQQEAAGGPLMEAIGSENANFIELLIDEPRLEVSCEGGEQDPKSGGAVRRVGLG